MLRWKDVDLNAGTAGMHWQITQLGWEPVQGRPKTEAGDRTIALDEDTITALRAHRRRTEKTLTRTVSERYKSRGRDRW
ncbi:hypothetical protein C1J01_18525 [Nonomuraea aridisoli]|uniref:Tyr recombinase domain-containing protein n=1 Tax=Nonomuraea aridisoli TaxID=2070368 RepID=A0A2W2EXK7_9ACTN|nr:hypothetical protein C1J01_18525 [Nonomuraea aridisoli]